MRADGAPPLLQIDDVIPIAFYLKVCQLLLAIYLRVVTRIPMLPAYTYALAW